MRRTEKKVSHLYIFMFILSIDLICPNLEARVCTRARMETR